MTSLVTDTTDTTDTTNMERDDEQTTDSDTSNTSDTHVRQHPAAQTRPLTETQTAYLPRTALGVIAVNWK